MKMRDPWPDECEECAFETASSIYCCACRIGADLIGLGQEDAARLRAEMSSTVRGQEEQQDRRGGESMSKSVKWFGLIAVVVLAVVLVYLIAFTPTPNIAPEAALLLKWHDAAPLALTFDGSQSTDEDGEIVRWRWDPGDGTGALEGAVVEHTYAEPSTYIIGLLVQDDDRATDTEQITHEIVMPVEPPVTEPKEVTLEEEPAEE